MSRSTFLRYFATKEEAVLGAFDDQGQRVADALRSRPSTEDDWTALRCALDTVIEHYRQDPTGSLHLASLVKRTPALCAKQLEKQSGWRPVLATALAQRSGTADDPGNLRPTVMAAAAVDCLNIAVDRWTDSGGTLDLEALVDEAFAVFASR